ncbi:hypothetical protein GF324_11055 [bacterium]|nr:hypothetical protein [bacterium]
MAGDPGSLWRGRSLRFVTPLDGKPLLVYTIDHLAAARRFREIILLVHPDWVPYAVDVMDQWELHIVRGILPAGEDFWDTLERGVKRVPGRYDCVAVLNAERTVPLPENVTELMDSAWQHGAALPIRSLPTEKGEVDDDSVMLYDGRHVGIQGPWCFRLDTLREILRIRTDRMPLELDLFSVLRESELDIRYILQSEANPRVQVEDDLDRVLEVLKVRLRQGRLP